MLVTHLAARTTRIAKDAATWLLRRRMRICSGSIVKILKKFAQTPDLFGGEGFASREMGDERRQPALEQPIKKTLALRLEVVCALKNRDITHPSINPLRADRLSLLQPVDKRSYRRETPVLRCDLFCQKLKGKRAAPPQRLHDLALSRRDGHEVKVPQKSTSVNALRVVAADIPDL